jgi:hypothetical protein
MSNILKGLNEGYFSRDEENQQNAMNTRRSSDLSRERNAGLDEPDDTASAPVQTRNGVYEYTVPAGQESIAQELGLQQHRGHWISRMPIQRANFQFGRPQFHEIPAKGVAEGSEWETRHDEFVTVGDRATPEQINKIVSALGVAAKQASSKRGFLNQIVGKQSNGDLARMAHGAETLAKNIQRNSKAKLGTDERKELGQQLVYAVSLLKRMNGEQGVAEGRATYGPITANHKAAAKKAFAAGERDGKAGAEKNKQYMSSALMKTTYLNGYNQGKQGVAEGQLDELSPNTLASYKKKAGADATQADKRGDYARGNKRMSGIMKATKKEFDNDAKSVNEEELDENLNKWFKEKWVRFGPDGKIRGDCARGDNSEGKPKCLPQSKAQNLGKEGRASAASRKRREDPNPERSGKAINVNTKKKSNEGVTEGVAETLPMNDAVKVLRQYGADNFKTTSNELHFYKNGRPFSVDLIWNDDATRNVSLSQLNAATRGLKGQGVTEEQLDELSCWSGYTRVQGVPAGAPGSCKKKTNEEEHNEKCPECGGPMFSDMLLAEKQDACYNKVKSRYKVWPSAYASGALVQCRKKGAANWGTGGKKNESAIMKGLNNERL